VDCAANFVKVATEETREAGLANNSFFIADIQTEDLRGPYDFLFARFGTMFLNAPVAALRDMRDALRSGGFDYQLFGLQKDVRSLKCRS